MFRAGLRNKTKRSENVCAPRTLVALFCVASASQGALPNGHELMAKSLAGGERNEEMLRSYVRRTRSVLKQLASDGSAKEEETKIYDDTVVDGFHVRTLVEKDGQPLTGADKQKEYARVAKLVAQRTHETPKAREKRLGDAAQEREKDRKFTREILDAFDFTVTGEESVNGRNAWVIDAVPHPGYQPKEMRSQMFTRLRGRVWVDQEDFIWVKAEADGTDSFGVGFSVLAKLDKGAHLSLEQIRLADGTWVVRRVGFKASGRIALVKHFNIDSVSTSEQFRKVPPQQRIGNGKDEY